MSSMDQLTTATGSPIKRNDNEYEEDYDLYGAASGINQTDIDSKSNGNNNVTSIKDERDIKAKFYLTDELNDEINSPINEEDCDKTPRINENYEEELINKDSELENLKLRNDTDLEQEEEDDEDSDSDDEVHVVISDIVNKPYSSTSLEQQTSVTSTNGTVTNLSSVNLNRQKLPTQGQPQPQPVPMGTGQNKVSIKGTLDLEATGYINGSVPTLEWDLQEINDEDKPWRKPGTDITDYFNYGFNEDTWIGYCAKQKRLRMDNLNFKTTMPMTNGSTQQLNLNVNNLNPLIPINMNNPNYNLQQQSMNFQQKPPPMQQFQRMPMMPQQQKSVEQSAQAAAAAANASQRRDNFQQNPSASSTTTLPPIVDFSAPPPGWPLGGPPPSASITQTQVPRMQHPQQQQQQRMPLNIQQQGFQNFNIQPSILQQQHNIANLQQQQQQVNVMGNALLHPDGRLGVGLPPPAAAMVYGQPPSTAFANVGPGGRVGVVNLPLPLQLQQQQGLVTAPTWEKPTTVEQQQVFFNQQQQLRNQSIQQQQQQQHHHQHHRSHSSRSPTPGVQSPSNARSPHSKSPQNTGSDSKDKYGKDNKYQSRGDYRSRGGDHDSSNRYSSDYHRSTKDRSRDRDRDRDRDRNRDRDRDRDRSDRDRSRSRDRDDKYKKRRKSDTDDDYRSSSKSHKRSKKSSRNKERDTSGERETKNATNKSFEGGEGVTEAKQQHD